MRTWIDIFDLYLYDINGCTIKAASDALRVATQIFCQRTKVWRVDLDPVVTRPGQQIYDFDVSDEIQIVKVFTAALDGKAIPLSADVKPGIQCIQPISPVQFALYPPSPAKGQKIQINAAIEPSITSSGVEDFIGDKYSRVLAMGAMARLYAEPGKPYSDANAAMDMRMQFDDAIGDVKAQIANAFSNAPVRVKAQFL